MAGKRRWPERIKTRPSSNTESVEYIVTWWNSLAAQVTFGFDKRTCLKTCTVTHKLSTVHVEEPQHNRTIQETKSTSRQQAKVYFFPPKSEPSHSHRWSWFGYIFDGLQGHFSLNGQAAFHLTFASLKCNRRHNSAAGGQSSQGGMFAIDKTSMKEKMMMEIVSGKWQFLLLMTWLHFCQLHMRSNFVTLIHTPWQE